VGFNRGVFGMCGVGVWDVWGGCTLLNRLWVCVTSLSFLNRCVWGDAVFAPRRRNTSLRVHLGDLPAPPSHTPLLLPFLSQDVLAYLAHKDADEVPLTPTPTQYPIQPPGRALACTPEEQPRLPHPGAMSSPQWFNGQS
jgi:hypothetical protein